MKLANPFRSRALPRAVLAVSIASIVLAGRALAVDVIWNGSPQNLTPADGGNDVTVDASTVVTLSGAGSTVLEDSIFNRSLGVDFAPPTLLTINSADATPRTLVSAVTILAGANGQSLVIAGSANFRLGLLGDGGFTGVQLVKNGGTGELILDGIFNDLDGALLRVVSGTVSVEGAGGTASPISSLLQPVRLDGATAKLRLGTPGGGGTTFNNALLVNDSGTLEHTAASNDTLTGSVIIDNAKTLTANVTAGELSLTGGVNGGGLIKTGGGALTLSGVSGYIGATTVSGGTFAVTGSLGNTVISVSAGATFAARPGSGIGCAGASNTSGTSSLTLLGGAASAAGFSMVDNAIGTFRIGTGGLTILGGAVFPTLAFEVGSTLGSIDRLDLATMGGNASIIAGTKVSFAGLSSATSLALGNYTFLTTAASGLGPVVLTLASSTITVGSLTYNLSLANSTATQEVLTISGGTLSNNSVIGVTPATASFGRVLATAIGTRTLTVSRVSGTSNTGATASVSGGAAGATVSATASGNGFITGAQSWVINVGLTGGVGAHSDTVVITNTGNDGSGAAPGGPGQGNAQMPLNVSVSGNVLGLRSVTGTPLSLGRQLAATNLNSLTQLVDFHSSGSHADTTDVLVDGSLAFNGATNIQSKSITGQNVLVSASGTFYSAPVVSGETGLGDTYGSVPVAYTAVPLAARVVTAAPLSLGRQLATTALNSLTRDVTFNSSGTHANTTDVMVDSLLTFDGVSNTQDKAVTGQIGSLAASGTFYSAPVVTDETGLGDTYANVIVTYTATPLALRAVMATPVSLGRQLATTNLGGLTRSVTFNSSGTHLDTTDVLVDGSLTFNGGSNAQGKNITGQGVVIAGSGTFYTAPVVTGEVGLGDTYANVTVTYTATPLALRSITGTAGDLGRVMSGTNLNTLNRTVTFSSTGLHATTTDVTVDGTLFFNGSSSPVKGLTGLNAAVASGGTFYSAPVVSAESGLGDTYANVEISYTATPVQDRVITADTVSFGLVHAGASVAGTATLRTTGSNAGFTAVSVGNASSGGFSLTGGTNPVFNSAGVTDGRTLGGTLGTAGVFTNATALTLAPGTEAGVAGVQNPVPVTVGYDASVFSGSAVWTGPGAGSWGQLGSAGWTDTVTAAIHAAPGTFGTGFAATDTAVFNAGGSGTVALDGAFPSLAAITFNGGSHTIDRGLGTGVLTLKNSLGPAAITDSAGSQSIAAPVVLSSDLIATVTQAADMLTLSGGISGAGKTLTKEGAGGLTLAGIQSYAALIANAGTTNVDGSFTDGTATVQANAAIHFKASQSLAALMIGDGVEVTFGDGLALAAAPEKFGAAVPEPGSAALALLGGLGLLIRRRRR